MAREALEKLLVLLKCFRVRFFCSALEFFLRRANRRNVSTETMVHANRMV